MKTQDQIQEEVTKYRYKAMGNWQYFPWGALNLTIPSFGPLHSYLCSYLCPYGNVNEKLFLIQKPTMRELKRFTESENNQNFLAKEIYTYCDRKYDCDKKYRSSLQSEVLEFLVKNDEFVKAFDAYLAARVFQGYFD